MTNLQILLHVALCAALAWSVFDRAVLMSTDVEADVRAVFCGLGVVALAGLLAPLVFGYVPDVFVLSLEAAIFFVQRITDRYWHAGVPDRFYKPGHAPRTRRATDMEAAP